MEKYKLIKEYPGSLTLNSVVFIDFSSDVLNYPEFWEKLTYPLGNTAGEDFNFCASFYHELPKKVPNNNPLNLEVGKSYLLQYAKAGSPVRRCTISTFTKEGYPFAVTDSTKGIIQPGDYKIVDDNDYEILSFVFRGSTIYNKLDNGLFEEKIYGSVSEKTLLEDDKANISSVKRLSDGEIFDIGQIYCFGSEKVTEKLTSIMYSEIIIGTRGRLCFVTENVGTRTQWNLRDLSKIKEKITITTLDGFDLTLGDRYYCVMANSTYVTSNKVSLNTIHTSDFTFFKDKENAKKYAKLNNFTFSLNMLEKILRNNISAFNLIKKNYDEIIGNKEK